LVGIASIKNQVGFALKTSIESTEERDFARSGIGWWLLLPVRLSIGLPLWIFDWLLNRFVIGAALAGIVFIPLHLFFGLDYKYWYRATIVFGIGLTGMWEGCEMFAIGPFLPRWLQLSPSKELPTINPMNRSGGSAAS
jgi:hypothetical protein